MKVTKIIGIRGDYTLLKTDRESHPYVVAFKFDKDSSTWQKGYCFSTLLSASVNIAKRAGF